MLIQNKALQHILKKFLEKYELGSLLLVVYLSNIKRPKLNSNISRRENNDLPSAQWNLQVCRTMFLNTTGLGCSAVETCVKDNNY